MEKVVFTPLQAGDASSGADFARAKRHKKLSARLNSAAARYKMAKLKRQSLYVLLFLLVIHTAAFVATRVLLADERSHVNSVCSPLLHMLFVMPADQNLQYGIVIFTMH